MEKVYQRIIYSSLISVCGRDDVLPSIPPLEESLHGRSVRAGALAHREKSFPNLVESN